MRNKKYSPPSKITKFTVKAPGELMDFLLTKMGGMSRNSVKSLLAHRQISVNGKVLTQFNHPLAENDSVIVNSTRGNIELTHPKLRIMHEDDDLIVVEKKRGITFSYHR
ncbi:MAG: hypothetical protein QM751_08485 [Paludibacteraceae bacterium]